MLRVECLRDIRNLETLTEAWLRLSRGAFMQSFEWSVAWLKAYAASHQPYVLVAYRDEEICAILPLAETHSVWFGRTLEFIGSGKVCSDNLGILMVDENTESIAESFANWLVDSEDGCRWDHLNLDGIRNDNLGMSHFAQSLSQRTGTSVQNKTSPNCWATSLDGGLTAIKSRLTKRGRKIFREAEAEVDSGRSQFEIAASVEQAIEFSREIERLHQARWSERGIAGCFAEKNFSDFLQFGIRSMWREADNEMSSGHSGSDLSNCSEPRVLVALLRIDGAPAAGSICFRDRYGLNIYLTGMSPQHSEVRPGWQLNTCLIKHAMAMGCDRYDFLRGDEEYKERLGATATVQNRWLIASPRWQSQLRNAAYRSAVNVKHWWKDQSKSWQRPAVVNLPSDMNGANVPKTQA